MKTISLIALLLCTSASVYAAPERKQDGPRSGEGQQRRGPPPEAFEACKGKAAGATAEMKSPRGDMVSGTCRMMLVPDRERNAG